MNPANDIRKHLADQAQEQLSQSAALGTQQDDLHTYVVSQRNKLADTAAMDHLAANKRKRGEKSPGKDREALNCVFDMTIVWKVQTARQELHRLVEPKVVHAIDADSQSQLVLQFEGDDMSRILQKERSQGDVPAAQWSALKHAADEEITR